MRITSQKATGLGAHLAAPIMLHRSDGIVMASASWPFGHTRRGRSSDGRALQSHCRGQGFDSPRLHQPFRCIIKYILYFLASTLPLLCCFGIALVSQMGIRMRPNGCPKRFCGGDKLLKILGPEMGVVCPRAPFATVAGR